jgi:hypothetical protein
MVIFENAATGMQAGYIQVVIFIRNDVIVIRKIMADF